MSTPARRRLIVNADDFGLSEGINRGITEAHESGIVTSASLMVGWPGSAEAAEYAKGRPSLSVGLHFDTGEWIHRDGRWEPLYRVVDTEDLEATLAEFERQLRRFRRLVGRDPTHLDSHQHVHRREPLLSALKRRAGRLGVPLRHASREVRYEGSFYGQMKDGQPIDDAVSPAALCKILRELEPGVTELCCHPGYAEDIATMYRAEREQETRALCDPIVRATIDIEGIELCSFADFRGSRASS